MPRSRRLTAPPLAPRPVVGTAAKPSFADVVARCGRGWRQGRLGGAGTVLVAAAAPVAAMAGALWALVALGLPGGAAPEASAAASALAEAPLSWLAAGAVLPLSIGALMLWRRGQESALQQAKASLEARLRAYDDLSHAFDVSAVVLRDPDGAIRHWSAGCERLFGFSAAEASGRLSHELLGTRFPDGGRRTAQEELLRTGEWRGELRHRGRGGRPVVVAAHWILRRDPATGEPAAVVELHADATALKAAEAALRAGEARLRLAQEVAGIGTWEWDSEQDSLVWSAEQHVLFGTGSAAAGAPGSLDAFLALVHPEDREAVRAANARALEAGEYEVEFRILRPGRNGAEELRWLIGRGRRMPGLAGRLGPVLGVNVDITARKEAEERQVLLMREVDHRAKNALAVVQAVLRLTRADSPDAFARAVEGRVAALARAQTLLAESRWAGAELRAMLQGELAPFSGEGSGAAPRVVLGGPPVTVAPIMAQPLSMAFHELATNAAKYGALSRPGGRLTVSWSSDPLAGRLRLRWEECGGPPVAGPPARRGFGSRVVETTIREQLGGSVSPRWNPEGLVCEMEIPLDRALAGRGLGPKA